MRKIEKKITIITFTENNDIYNTGIVTSNSKAIYVLIILWIKYWEQKE